MNEYDLTRAIQDDNVEAVLRELKDVPIDTTFTTGVVLPLFGEPHQHAGRGRQVVSSLDYATLTLSTAVVGALLERGASPTPGGSDFPALFCAAHRDDEVIFAEFLRRGANPEFVAGSDGITASMVAAARASVGCWRILRDLSVSIAHRDSADRSVLFYAARNARPPKLNEALEIARDCLNAGLDPSATDKDGLTPTLVAASASYEAAVLLLSAGGDPAARDANGLTFLLHAARSKAHRLDQALTIDPDVSSADRSGRTALHYAVQRPTLAPRAEAVSALISASVDVNRKDSDGRTAAIHAAAFFGAWETPEDNISEVLFTLLEGGLDTSIADKFGNNIWHYICDENGVYRGTEDSYRRWYCFWDLYHPLEYLTHDSESAEAGFNTNIRRYENSVLAATRMLQYSGGSYGLSDQNAKGRTPLMLIEFIREKFWMNESRFDLLKLVLSRRPDLFAIDIDGNNALHLLCSHGLFMSDTDALEAKHALALCTQGCDVNARNFQDESPYRLARNNKLYQVQSVLSGHGAKSNENEDQFVHREPVIEVAAFAFHEMEDLGSDDLALEVLVVQPHVADSAGGSQEVPDYPSDATEDPKAASLHEEARKAYSAANDAYRAMVGHDFPFIKINSGRRSVTQQVQLYRAFIESVECEGPDANPANKPGKSWHNFGMAVDIVRGTDQERLSKALEENGWVAAHEDEGWHFEAQGAPSWPKLAQLMAEVIGPLADQVAEYVVNAVLFGCYIKRNESDMLAREREMAELTRTISEKRQLLQRRRSELNKLAAELTEESADIAREQSAVNDLRQRIAQMVYDRCPNGQPFAECTHEDYKRAWLADRESLRRELADRERRLQQRRTEWQAKKRQWQEDDRVMRVDEQAFKKEEIQYRAKKTEFDKIKKKFLYWKQQRQLNEARIITGAAKIQEKLDGAATGS